MIWVRQRSYLLWDQTAQRSAASSRSYPVYPFAALVLVVPDRRTQRSYDLSPACFFSWLQSYTPLYTRGMADYIFAG